MDALSPKPHLQAFHASVAIEELGLALELPLSVTTAKEPQNALEIAGPRDAALMVVATAVDIKVKIIFGKNQGSIKSDI